MSETETPIEDVASTEESQPKKRRYLRRPGKVTDARVTRLQQEYLAGRPSGRRDLAELRQAVGRVPGDVPAVWALTDIASEPDTVAPTSDEWAVHIAMCLYAVHQQGRNLPAHVPGRPFAQAVNALTGEMQEKSPVWRRFTAALLADDIEGLRGHLQGIVGQMHSNKNYTPFDYAVLADDIAQLQDPARRSGVRLRWQREFYSPISDKKTDKDSNKKKED